MINGIINNAITEGPGISPLIKVKSVEISAGSNALGDNDVYLVRAWLININLWH